MFCFFVLCTYLFLLSFCSICMHSIMDATFAVMFDETSCITVSQSIKITARLKLGILEMVFGSVTSIVLTSPYTPVGI